MQREMAVALLKVFMVFFAFLSGKYTYGIYKKSKFIVFSMLKKKLYPD